MNTRKLYWLIGILVFMGIIILYSRNQLPSAGILEEGFSSQKVSLKGPKIYDDFYCEIYDQLFQSDLRTEYECMQMHKLYFKTWEGEKVRILDIGCGTGHHLRILKRYGHTVEGLDRSAEMIKRARKQCPEAALKVGNFDDSKTYPKRSFSHIICLFFRR